MINLIEYGKEILIDKSDYNDNDRIFLNSIRINAKNQYRFEIREVNEGLYIKPFSYVGSIQLSKKKINIFPRFDHNFKSLIPMILFTKDIKFKYFKQELNTSSANDDLIEVVIALFLKEVEGLFKNSLLKGYVKFNENLNVIRGRIDFSKHLTKNFLRGENIYCDYDELSHDVLENQVILEGLRVCLLKTCDNEKRRAIRKYMSILENCCTRYRRSKFPNIKYNRLNDHYKEIHYYCKLIIENIGIDNIYDRGSFSGKYSLLIDMNELFECFISKLCTKYLSHKYEVISQWNIKNAIVDYKNTKYRMIIPDIVLIDKVSEEYTIIDTKNKNYGQKKVSNEDIYQLNFYGMYFSNMYNKKVNISIVYPKYNDTILKKDKLFLNGIDLIENNVKIDIVGVDINECLEYIYIEN